jgi:hypothetical protein
LSKAGEIDSSSILIDVTDVGSIMGFKKEVSGLRLLSRLLYTQEAIGSSPVPPTI